MLFLMFEWLEATPVAQTIQGSLVLSGALSALHLLGLALVAGGALFSNLAGFGVLGPKEYRADALPPAGRGISIGLAISLVTGFLLLMPRAVTAAENSTFRIKMVLLALAALIHVTLQRAGPNDVGGMAGAARVLGLMLWLGVALAGCAFILLE